MIAEKSNTAQALIDRLSGKSKVSFMSEDAITRSLNRLETKGIPGSRDEDYKYCNLDGIIKKEFRSASGLSAVAIDKDQHGLRGFINLFIVNGDFDEALSDKLPAGVTATSFSRASASQGALLATLADPGSDAFIALSTAFSGNGVFIECGPGINIEQPLCVTCISSSETEAAVNPRSFVLVGERSSITVIERQLLQGNGKVFTNSLSEKIVEKGAKLTTALIQDQGMTGYSVSTTQVRLASGAEYENVTVTLSGQVVRNNHNVVMAGERSVAHLYGLFSSRHSQLVDNHTLMDHEAPHCESNELYKGLADDKSTGVFNGKIFVRRHAQKTNAYQSSKNILLSDDATINTKPQLEIYADDVKCSHGTSTGRIDTDALFYLNARGIGAESARRMLLASFANEVISRIPVETLRTDIAGRFGGTP